MRIDGRHRWLFGHHRGRGGRRPIAIGGQGQVTVDAIEVQRRRRGLVHDLTLLQHHEAVRRLEGEADWDKPEALAMMKAAVG